MAYIAPIHRPSSVRHALLLSFTSTETPDLIIAKANRLEIWSPSPNDPSYLVHLHTKSLYGKVTLLAKLRPARSSTDHLFVGTDRYHFFTLSWDAEAKQLKTERAFQDVAEKSARDSQTGDRVHIDPSSRFVTLECHEGVINVLPIAHAGKGKRKIADPAEIGELGDPIPVRIPELFVKATGFLHKRHTGPKPTNPEIVVLWEDTGTGKMRCTVRELEYTPSLRPQEELGTAELEKGREVQGEVELGASHVIPLPPPMYGMLLVGETRVSYVDEWDYRVQRTEALDEATVFVAWCAVDEQRYVLADDYGKLYLLFVQQNQQGEFAGLKIDVLGETSRASTLVYLDGGRIFVGSHQGDSQIIQISEGQGLEVMQTFANIAPILDFTVMDMGNRTSDAPVNEFSSGQARIVTGSGAFKDGSLRSVRSGVGLEDLGAIGDMGAPVSGIFALRSGNAVDLDDTLVVSFVSHSRIFTFSGDGEVEEVEEFRGFRLGESTLHASSLPDGRAVQVTSSAVTLSDADAGMVTDTWEPPAGQSITAVSAERSTILISLGGAKLVVLDLSGNAVSIQGERDFTAQEQVSCIALSPAIPNACVAGFWKDSRVSFLKLSDLSPITSSTVADDQNPEGMLAVPRSLAIANILPNQPATLFIGLADGNVVTYSLTSSPDDLFANRKSIILGTQQPNFALLPRNDGLQNVFATCENPSLIYSSEGRMVYSAITAENATFIVSFSSAAYPNAIAIATEDNELKLAMVDEERTTHVQTLPVHQTVRRIAYSPDLRTFGLGTIKRTLLAGEEVVESHFKIVDEVAFQELFSYVLPKDELIECCIRCKLPDGVGGMAERFIIGTAYLDDAEPNRASAAGSGDAAVRGRIMVFEVTESRELKVVAQHGLRGACRCLGVMEGSGRIVAALVKTVVVYSFEYQTPSSPFLFKLAAYRTSTAPIDIAIHPTTNIIAVTDLMKSVTLLSYKHGSVNGGSHDLSEIARHFDTLWGTAVAPIDATSYLAADAEGNLVVLQHDKDGFSEEDRRRLRVTSEMLLGEMVNRIRPVTVTPTPNAVIIPRAFCATVEGGVYLFALIAPGKQDLLIRLQERLSKVLEAPGGVPFAKFRGFKTGVRNCGDEGPMRFVDGEVMERFLDLEQAVQADVVEGLPGISAGEEGVEEVRGLVDGLRRVR